MDEMTQRFLTNMLIDAQALVEELRKPKPIDWPAEARKAAMMLWASGEFSANDSLSNAEVLIAEMKRREAFGGGG
ncbi:MAG: hypothetical protein IPH13_20260 [Planctomycetes bacterium]|nr:hypothetical protein [Planctomycetota bacterium]